MKYFFSLIFLFSFVCGSAEAFGACPPPLNFPLYYPSANSSVPPTDASCDYLLVRQEAGNQSWDATCSTSFISPGPASSGRYWCYAQKGSCSTTGIGYVQLYSCSIPVVSCSDGIQNGNETGVDCGGSCPVCDSCAGKEYIGGCDGLPKFCEGSPEYQSVLAFVQANSDIRQSWYFLTVGSNGEQYKCMNYYKDGTGAYVLPITISPSTIDPSKSSGCLTTTVWNAFECKYVLNAQYSGLSTKYGTGIAGICIDPVTGAYINCSVTQTKADDGSTVTQDGATGRTISTDGSGTVTGDSGGTGTPTGTTLCKDANKDGLDDVTGVPCSSGDSTVGQTGQIKPCVDLNKDSKDDVTGEPCVTGENGSQTFNLPGVPTFDTKTDEVKEEDYKGVIGSFLSNHPFISIIQNTGIKIESASCKVEGDVLGKNIALDFCPLKSIINVFGIAFVGICTIRSFYIAFGVGE